MTTASEQPHCPHPPWITWAGTDFCHRFVDGRILCGIPFPSSMNFVSAASGVTREPLFRVPPCPSCRALNYRRWVAADAT